MSKNTMGAHGKQKMDGVGGDSCQNAKMSIVARRERDQERPRLRKRLPPALPLTTASAERKQPAPEQWSPSAGVVFCDHRGVDQPGAKARTP